VSHGQNFTRLAAAAGHIRLASTNFMQFSDSLARRSCKNTRARVDPPTIGSAGLAFYGDAAFRKLHQQELEKCRFSQPQ